MDIQIELCEDPPLITLHAISPRASALFKKLFGGEYVTFTSDPSDMLSLLPEDWMIGTGTKH